MAATDSLEGTRMPRRWKIFTLVGLVSLIADQITKVWARSALPTNTLPDGRSYGQAVPVIENFFDWRLSFNPGSAFSLFGDMSGARVFLSLIGIVAVAGIFWMMHKARNDQTRLAWALGLLVGGAVGNLVDRIYSGEVTDFVVWKYYDKEWPTFNVADVALVIGVGLLFLDMIKDARAQREAEVAEATSQSTSQSKAGGSGKRSGARRAKPHKA